MSPVSRAKGQVSEGTNSGRNQIAVNHRKSQVAAHFFLSCFSCTWTGAMAARGSPCHSSLCTSFPCHFTSSLSLLSRRSLINRRPCSAASRISRRLRKQRNTTDLTPGTPHASPNLLSRSCPARPRAHSVLECVASGLNTAYVLPGTFLSNTSPPASAHTSFRPLVPRTSPAPLPLPPSFTITPTRPGPRSGRQHPPPPCRYGPRSPHGAALVPPHGPPRPAPAEAAQ